LSNILQFPPFGRLYQLPNTISKKNPTDSENVPTALTLSYVSGEIIYFQNPADPTNQAHLRAKQLNEINISTSYYVRGLAPGTYSDGYGRQADINNSGEIFIHPLSIDTIKLVSPVV
jgi:hypothetical protein